MAGLLLASIEFGQLICYSVISLTSCLKESQILLVDTAAEPAVVVVAEMAVESVVVTAVVDFFVVAVAAESTLA